MAIDRVLSGDSRGDKEEQFNSALRPQKLTECIGQQNVKEKLSIAVQAARQRGEPLDCRARDVQDRGAALALAARHSLASLSCPPMVGRLRN